MGNMNNLQKLKICEGSERRRLGEKGGVHSEGLEPPTYGSEDRCSIQLSYECKVLTLKLSSGRRLPSDAIQACQVQGHRFPDPVYRLRTNPQSENTQPSPREKGRAHAAALRRGLLTSLRGAGCVVTEETIGRHSHQTFLLPQ